MTPYYADDLVTLYHGDCREWMPDLLRRQRMTGDLVLVTDPPYGYSHASNWEGPWRDEAIKGDESTETRDAILTVWGTTAPAVVFGSCKVAAPVGVRATLVWDKGLAAGMGDLSMPWKPNWEHIYIIGSGFAGRRDSGVISGHNVVTWASRGRNHPNEKPVPLMVDLISKCPPGTVLDPFAGSGSTLVAAKTLGRRSIGIELDERWAEVAANRCRQEVLGLSA